jgi:hypothetical protein
MRRRRHARELQGDETREPGAAARDQARIDRRRFES